ncbi:uncharacterized protein LOC120645728 [Panicum virgatum]|uniref:uncharacterized protein LOC120645728 n=1 Tax=Panicum virgatum TaxID=38727 RepID=UPI0019D591CA|nr:uncharacterized protein LOC120645728 [Panicum virgatum]
MAIKRRPPKPPWSPCSTSSSRWSATLASAWTEIFAVRQETRLISASVKNVQTQILDKQGRFDTHDASSSGKPAAPGHKLRFRKYDGSDVPITWLHKGEQFFRAYGTPEHLKVPMASFYLDGADGQWYYRLEKNQGVPSWSQFVDGFNRRFGPPLRSNPLGELTQLRRTSTVDDYQEQFLLLLARCEDVTELQQIAIFTAGLQQPLSTDVEMQKPATLEDAMALARVFERRKHVTTELSAGGGRTTSCSAQRASVSSSWSTPATPTTGSTLALPVAAPKPPSPTDGCFKCLSPEGSTTWNLKGCASTAPRNSRRNTPRSAPAKGSTTWNLTTVMQRRTPKRRTTSPSRCTPSQASARVPLYNSGAATRGATMVALIDSGSTHSFISDAMALRVGLVPTPRPGLSVGVANGDRVPIASVCRGVSMTVEDEQFSADFYVLPLEGYDLILGCDWLHSLGPVVWDLSKLSMMFWRHDHQVRWIGVHATLSPCLAVTQAIKPLMALLAEFDDLFATPSGLPPPRQLDHRIHLLPNTPPVAVRPYRYAQMLKDEIEAQCQAMLEQGIIRASTSAFSSPVLLVRKRDGSWRFCVDYRALNSKTVRDKFLIPIVEELLDELKDAVFFTKLDLRSGYHQVRMHPDDIAKTPFRTHHGHFELLVMPFGLTNAPSTFQALMNEVLRPFLRRCVLIFDDILIFSRTETEHL